MKRKSKKQQPNSAMTAFAAILVAGLIATTAATYISPMQPDYDMDAYRKVIEQITNQDKPTKVEPVKLRKLKEPKRIDTREAKLTYLFLYGNDKESAKARQLLANK